MNMYKIICTSERKVLTCLVPMSYLDAQVIFNLLHNKANTLKTELFDGYGQLIEIRERKEPTYKQSRSLRARKGAYSGEGY